MSGRQRLGVQDALWLEMDTPGNLMVVDSLFWTAHPIVWDDFVKVMRERLWDRYLVFRSVVAKGDDGAWYWEEQPGATIDDRFQRVTLPEPGGDAELQELVAAERVVPLDRSEPLWRALLVDGFHGGSAVLFRGHHAIADGIRMVQLALSILDVDEHGAAATSAPVVEPQPVLLPDDDRPSLTGRVGALVTSTAGASVRIARSAVTNPVGAAHTAKSLSEALSAQLVSLPRRRGLPLLAAVPGDVDTARKLVLGTRNDSSQWTGHVGERKAISWSPPLPLDHVKRVARANGATVNDVLVTCVAQSLRTYLDAHHSICHSVTWDVPVNLKPFDPSLPVELGNGFALVQLELPTHIEDPLRTLEVVRHRMGRIKSGHEAVVDFGVQAAVARLSKRMYRAIVDLIANRAVGVLTNVPGPQVPLYVTGQRVEGMMGWAPTAADQIMSFTIYSYAGQVFVGLAADAHRVPDHQQVVDGFGAAFRSLAIRTAES